MTCSALFFQAIIAISALVLLVKMNTLTRTVYPSEMKNSELEISRNLKNNRNLYQAICIRRLLLDLIWIHGVATYLSNSKYI